MLVERQADDVGVPGLDPINGRQIHRHATEESASLHALVLHAHAVHTAKDDALTTAVQQLVALHVQT